MDNHDREVVTYTGACCANTRTVDHFCGNGSVLKRGMRSRCNTCEKEVPASAFKSNDVPARVYLVKYCPDHGETSTRISSDAAFYYRPEDAQACACGPGGCGPTPLGENAVTGSTMHTCTLVVEIVTDCNLACPTCYANSPQRAPGAHGTFLSVADFQTQVQAVLGKQGEIDIIQLSGGEPTLHPQLFEIITWLGTQTGIGQVLLNTNGSKLVDDTFTTALATVAPVGRFGVYLQYDGDEESGQVPLRGGDFRAIRERAIANCQKHALPIALVMTVTHDNKFSCASAITRAIADDNITWVVFQPEFLSGRNDKRKMLEIPINVADIVHSVALGGIMDLGSWMPLPCSDPNCGTIGFLVRVDDVWQPVSKLIDLRSLTTTIANRINFTMEDALSVCGCDDYNLGEYLERYGVKRKDIKMIFIKPFMDSRTWDAARIAACCTHVLTPTGELDSFCRYYGSK